MAINLKGDNNPPYATLDLSKQEYALLVKTCDANLLLGLGILQQVQAGVMNEKAGRDTVELIEAFRGLKTKLDKAKL